MADVWIGRKRWTCKYCNVTINDDIPSRQHHESGQRHKNNVERSLRGLYKENSEKRREEERAAREMALIERDTPDQPRVRMRPTAPPPPKAWKPGDSMASYTTAKALGVGDEDEAEWQKKFARRTGAAKVGEWETVTAPEPPQEEDEEEEDEEEEVVQEVPLVSERDKARSFQITEKTLEDEEDDDLPVIVTKRPRTAERTDVAHASDASGEVKTEPGIKEEAQDIKDDPDADTSVPAMPLSGDTVKQETPAPAESLPAEAPKPPADLPSTAAPAALSTTPASAPSDAPDLFRKRKVRGGATKKVGGGAFA